MSNRHGPSMYRVHIADGFADDCEELIHRCPKKDPLTFHQFCKIWKNMNFASMYKDRCSGAEIAELSEEVLHIAKRYMIANTSNFEETVAGLFLVYALLNLQPFTGFAVLRLIPEDMVVINRIEMVARREKRFDVLYILASVLINGPCQYHAAQRERGMELQLRKYLEGCTGIDRMGVRPKGVFYRQNEELDILRDLINITGKYSEYKIDLDSDAPQGRNLYYLDGNVHVEMDLSLKRIINGILDDDADTPDTHITALQALKAKAMGKSVGPVRHLTGINERRDTVTTSRKTKTEIKSKPGKIKSGSPTKPAITGSPNVNLKRKQPVKKKIKKKRRKKVSESDTDDSDEDFLMNDVGRDRMITAIPELNLKDFGKGKVEEVEALEKGMELETTVEIVKLLDNDIEQEMDVQDEMLGDIELDDQQFNIQIDSLPVFIKTQNQDNIIEIEIIDHQKNAKPVRETRMSRKAKLVCSDVSFEKVSTNQEPPEICPNVTLQHKMAEIKRVASDNLFKVPKPVAKKAKLAPNTAKPAANTAKPEANIGQPAANTAKPAVNTAKPAANTAKPAAKKAKPAAKKAKPAAKKAKPVANTAKSVAKLAKLVEVSEPVRLRRREKREQKKTLLKSKFKRMGMLPVANFEDGY